MRLLSPTGTDQEHPQRKSCRSAYRTIAFLCLGAWTIYGLGTENQNLPGFILLKPSLAHGGARNWGSSFLPGAYQGTAIGHAGLKIEEIEPEPIRYLRQKKFSPMNSATSSTCYKT